MRAATVVVPTYGHRVKLADSLERLMDSDDDGVPFDIVHQHGRHDRLVAAITRPYGAAD